MPTTLSRRMSRVKPSAIRELLALGARSDIISFGGGYPDPDLFPLTELDAIYHEAIASNGREALQYSTSNGLPRLREQIAERLTKDGTPTHPENVLILQGAQQGLDLVAKMLIDPGDVIVTEDPTFLGALIAFNPLEPRYATVSIDGDGLDVDELEDLLSRERCKFIYTVPDFQNPTGHCLSLERRHRLIALANRYDTLIVEDSPYREIRFEGEHLPTLKSLDTEGRVIHIGSFSKILAPGLRIGWAVADDMLIQQLGLLKLAADTQCSTLNMTAISLFIERYDIDVQIAKIAETYRHKKNLMLESLRESLPPGIAFTDAAGGLFTWLTFPPSFDAATFMRDHALPRAGVAYVPGATFFPVVERHNHARLSFATQSDHNIRTGIKALGELLGETIAAG